MKVFSVSYLPPMGLNAAGYQRAYGDLATIRKILRKTITSSLQYQCFTERHCMEVLTLLAQVICTICTFSPVHSYTVVHKFYGIAVQQLMDLVYIKGINDMPPLLTSSGKHCAVSVFHSGYRRDDSRQYMTISACLAAVVFLGTLSQKRTKKGTPTVYIPGFSSVGCVDCDSL